jgi:hypothetical protein
VKSKAISTETKKTPPTVTQEHKYATLAVDPVVSAAQTVQDFSKRQGPLDVVDLHKASMDIHRAVRDGDLGQVENMLLSQAMALESVFHALAQRAQVQQNPARNDALLVLAMKAQNGSRATLAALIELKQPRQSATFVKQTNQSAGPMQVNVGGKQAPALQPPAPLKAIDLASGSGYIPVLIPKRVKTPSHARAREEKQKLAKQTTNLVQHAT